MTCKPVALLLLPSVVYHGARALYVEHAVVSVNMAELSKHKHDDDCCDLSFLCSPAKSARVQGVLTQLSSMKAGKYFDGCLADSSSTSIRIVGFDAKKQEQLAHIYEMKQSLVMKNCHN